MIPPMRGATTNPVSSGEAPRANAAGAIGRAGADDIPPFRYDAKLAADIETRWQAYWDSHRTFVQPNPGEAGFDASRPKYYVLDMFPYPSGAGLHVGHPEGYTATDIVSRFKRMKGCNVLHPMGWDAFGLPAEQYAIQTGIHPAVTTKDAIDNFRRQLKRFGFSYDWSRECGTIDPEFYRWTQWIFLKAYGSWFDPWAKMARPISALVESLTNGDLRVDPSGDVVHIGAMAALSGLTNEPPGLRRWHELGEDERRAVLDNQRLVYLGETTVNWCPALGTVLANDEVIDGRSERGNHPVVRKPLKQWMFRITAYAERLLADLDGLEWPESTKTMQREWIGKSEGAEIDFEVVGSTQPLRVFTTRPDTIFGATYMVVAPEHPLVKTALDTNAAGANGPALRAYVERARTMSEVDRQGGGGGGDAKEKTGVFTGLMAINPATGEKIPVWAADYVLMGYGHGAIMAVPAHDERDFAFARAFGLPIRDVVYSRTFAAMKFYSEHAQPEEVKEGKWPRVAADMLGLSTTAEANPEIFERVLEAVRTRRESRDEFPKEHDARGQVRGEWDDALKGFLHKSTFDEFARAFNDARVMEAAGAAHSGNGFAVNSKGNGLDLNGLETAAAKAKTIEWLEEKGFGARKTTYRLRDWAFSRQRYWGEPFPIVYDEQGNHYPVGEGSPPLPVTLPELSDYAPVESDEPRPLLAKAKQWMETTAREAGVDPKVLEAGARVWREANTMPGSAGSSWYFLRYCDARNSDRFVGEEAEQYWMGGGGTGGVDLYVGGSEHAVGHLLYSRFWQKVLFDLGYVSTPEPFQRLFHQGLITAYSFQRADKRLVPNDQVEVREVGGAQQFFERGTNERMTPVIAKMSKSLKNVVNPDEIIAEYGADTFRLYEMYMGPLEASKPWNTKDTIGCYRLLQRVWRLAVDERTGAVRVREDSARDAALEKLLHRTILKVEADIPKLALNTAIGAIFEFVNAATAASSTGPALTKDQLERFVLVLAPFAPHIAEEIWAKLGHPGSLAYHPYPMADEKMAAEDRVEIPIQINGKVRHKIEVEAGATREAIEAAAMGDAKVKELLGGASPKKVVVVPGKMVNFVV